MFCFNKRNKKNEPPYKNTQNQQLNKKNQEVNKKKHPPIYISLCKIIDLIKIKFIYYNLHLKFLICFKSINKYGIIKPPKKKTELSKYLFEIKLP